MNKRGPESMEENDGPEAKRGPAGLAGSSGARAETVKNPIPRLFSTQTLTFHFTQRTFEEVGPGELLYLRTCTSPIFMLDQSHMNIINRYMPNASTFQVHQPQAKVSNILMLQDEIKTESGTPRDVTAYTQACYLIKYTPTRINNWFKLGCTSDCGKTQKMLSLDLANVIECNNISQLAKLDNYTNFEQLTINPARPYKSGGWNSYATIEHGFDEDADSTKDPQILIEENYMSPEVTNPLRDFSCNYKGIDPHMQMNKHPTYVRNLDKWSLYKYGEEFDIPISDNLSGLDLITSSQGNVPSYNQYEILGKIAPLKKDNYAANCLFTYPSRNCPYFTRKDNFSYITPVESKNKESRIPHTFITMPPIKKNDGSLIKQRASFLLEQSMVFTMQFPEYTSENESIVNMISQNNGVILRPGFFSIQQKSKELSPDSREIWDPRIDKKREDKLKEWIENYQGDWDDGTDPNTPYGRIVSLGKKLFKNASDFAIFCQTLKKVCPDIFANTTIPANEITPWDEFKLPADPLSDEELRQMLLDDGRKLRLWSYTFYFFLQFLEDNNIIIEDTQNYKIVHISGTYFQSQGYTLIQSISNRLLFEIKNYWEIISNQQCADILITFNVSENTFNNFTSMEMWDRQSDPSMSIVYDRITKSNWLDMPKIFRPNKKVQFPLDLYMQFLCKMNIYYIDNEDYLKKYVTMYNDCITRQVDEKLPRKKVHILETQSKNASEPVDYKTELFFV